LTAERLFIPGPTAHALLHRAFVEARRPATAYRIRYNLPRTDPRFLDTTEDEIIFDLLTCTYFEHEVRKAIDPDAVAGELAQARNLAEGYRKMEEDFTSGKMQEQILAFVEAEKGSDEKAVKIVRIRPGKVSAG
jgi:hypothetical protein